MVKRIGVFGGTFDPVHLGHVMIAERVGDMLELSQVILVPAGQPLLKPPHAIAPAGHRLQMLRLAVAGNPRLTISNVEIERPGPSYTVDTIAELRQEYGSQAEVYFILGWDSLEQLASWREPARLVSLCYLAAVPRPGYHRPDLESLEASVPGISQRVVFLDTPLVDISATDIRERTARGDPIEDLVPGPVVSYIIKHKLYRED